MANGYWRAGFAVPSALPAISLMGGLVDILDVLYTAGALYFFLRCTDSTDTIFRNGFLRGTKIEGSLLLPKQPLLVDASFSGPISRGSDLS